jgi:hypothetical protein
MKDRCRSKSLTPQFQAAAITLPHSVHPQQSLCRAQFTLAGFQVSRKLLDSFVDGFRRFDVDVRLIRAQNAQLENGIHVNACALPLNGHAISWLRKTSWYSPRRTVLYAVGDTKRLSDFPDLAVNALLQTGTFSNVLAAIDATQPILVRGISQSARVPIAIPVAIEADGKSLIALTKNVGYGGMAVILRRMPTLPETVTVTFSLPEAGSFSLAAVPRWYSGPFVGLQFRSLKEESSLKEWVKSYSSLGSSHHQGRARGIRENALSSLKRK